MSEGDGAGETHHRYPSPNNEPNSSEEEMVSIFSRPKLKFISHGIWSCFYRIWTQKLRLLYPLSCSSQKCAVNDLTFCVQILLKHDPKPWEINCIFGLLKINTLSSSLIQNFCSLGQSSLYFKICTFICKSAVPTLGTLECLEKLVQTYSCKGQYSGTSVARPLKFCVSYRGLKSYLWSNFHASVTSGSRVIEGSHCPNWFCFYQSMFLTVSLVETKHGRIR